MFKKYACVALVVTLVCTLCPSRIFAQAMPPPAVKSSGLSETPVSGSAEKKGAQAGRSLKADIEQLVTEAKAGKRLVIIDPQIQPKQSNSLSKGAKIAIIAGVAIVVILIIVVIHEKNHFFDDFRLGG